MLARVRDLFASGAARRFGAVFDSRSLGYDSTLCAVDVPVADLEAVAACSRRIPALRTATSARGGPTSGSP